jgi:hypothetical protein
MTGNDIIKATELVKWFVYSQLLALNGKLLLCCLAGL